MFSTIMKVIFWPFTLLSGLFDVIGAMFNVMGSVFSKVFGIAAVLLISAIILGGFKLYDKVKGPKEEEQLASGDTETFNSYYEQKK